MLENVLWGNTIKDWGISILIILITIVVMKVVSYIGRKVIKKLTRKTETPVDDMIFDSFESPVLFGIILLGTWIAIHHLVYTNSFAATVNDTFRILVVLNITWFLARLVNGFLEIYWVKRREETHRAQRFSGKMLPVVKRTLLTVVWLVGIVTALSNVGVNISALLGTLGIGGIAFALAAQDTVKNVFGAFTILSDRPFAIGDTIKVDNFEGTIIDVGIRSTKMRNSDKRIITFPNYKIVDAYIINVSAEPMKRVVINIGLTYDTSPEKMKQALEILRNIPEKIKYVSKKDIVAHFSGFLESALGITFVYYIEKKGDTGKIISDVNMEILTAFNEAGLKFAFPSQTLYLKPDDLKYDNI